MRILIVEDNVVIGIDLVETLGEAGYTVDGPHPNIADALAAIEAHAPDLAVLDIDLLDDETSAPVAEVLADRGIPFLTVSGFSSRSARKDEIFRHARRIDKPFEDHTLLDAIETLTRQSRTER